MLKGMPDYYDMSMLLHGLGETHSSVDILFLTGDRKKEESYLCDFLLSLFLEGSFQAKLKASRQYDVGYVAYLAWLRSQNALNDKATNISKKLEVLTKLIAKRFLLRFQTRGIISEEGYNKLKDVNFFKALNTKIYMCVYDHTKAKEQRTPVQLSGVGSKSSKKSISSFIIKMISSEISKENAIINDAVKGLILEAPEVAIKNTLKIVLKEDLSLVTSIDALLNTLLRENEDVFQDPTPLFYNGEVEAPEISKELLLFIYDLSILIFYTLTVDMKLEDASGKSYEFFLASSTDNLDDAEKGEVGVEDSKKVNNSKDRVSEISIFDVMARSAIAMGLTAALIRLSKKRR